MFKAVDSEELAKLLEKNIRSCYLEDDWIDGAVGSCGFPQETRRNEAYDDYDEAQDRRQPMPFEQDTLSSPPLAWVLFWDGLYSNLVGVYIPDVLRRWGYVMWDAKRLEDSGAKEYIQLEWECEYGVRGPSADGDPRDNYWSEWARDHEEDGQ